MKIWVILIQSWEVMGFGIYFIDCASIGVYLIKLKAWVDSEWSFKQIQRLIWRITIKISIISVEKVFFWHKLARLFIVVRFCVLFEKFARFGALVRLRFCWEFARFESFLSVENFVRFWFSNSWDCVLLEILARFTFLRDLKNILSAKILRDSFFFL